MKSKKKVKEWMYRCKNRKRKCKKAIAESEQRSKKLQRLFKCIEIIPNG